MPDNVETTDQSLEQLEGRSWGDPPPDAGHLVATVHALRRRPIDALGVEDLRVLIGQDVGVAVLLPRALAVLAQDQLVEGDHYPGDLLAAVLRVPGDYWRTRPAELARVTAVAAAVADSRDRTGARDAAELLELLGAFLEAHAGRPGGA